MPTTARSSSGSVSPRWATAITSTPRRRAVSAKRTGNRPLPAINPMRSTPIRSTPLPLAADPAPRSGKKVHQSSHVGHVSERLPGGVDRRAPGSAPLEQQPVGALDRTDGRRREAPAPEAEPVDAMKAGAISRHRAELRGIHGNHGAGCAQRRLTDPHVLMY